jgi:thiol-disulfide isomerase/thioredoxin
MRKYVAIPFIVALTACGTAKQSKVNYETLPDSEAKILKGTINRDIIQNDTTYRWFNENMKYGTADPAAVEAFKNNADKFSMVVFGGTWCHDTQNLLPVFYRLVDKSGYPESKITLIGVDREKTALDNLHKKYNVTNVPTFIVISNGKEIGRVVEYGKYGQVDKELGEIVASLSTQ